MNPTRVLYVSSATNLFLKEPPLSTYVEDLSTYTTNSSAFETRLLLPRFGVIKERPNNIHETIRLSGINIPMGKDRISLVVKVPSVRGIKIATYFVDNEVLFQRKGVFTDKKGEFYPDNDVRALFFCKSVLAIIEKLGWIPHIIHCHGWMSSFLLPYLKKAYTDSHPLKHTKSIYTLYDEPFDHHFSRDMLRYARYKQLKISDLEENFNLPEKIGFQELTRLAIDHADHVTRVFETPQVATAWQQVPYSQAQYIAPDQEGKEDIYLNIYNELRTK